MRRAFFFALYAAFIILTAEQADLIRGPTDGGAELDPRQVEAGQHAGKFVLPARVLGDRDHRRRTNFLRGLPQVEIDPAVAWPE